MTHTREEVRETNRQIRLLEMVDVLEFMVSETLGGKDLTAFWNKLFVNIDDVPTEAFYEESNFTDQITDMDRLDLDEDIYEKLVQEWSMVKDLFEQLIAVLPEDLKILARKFFIRTGHKRKKFEQEHKGALANKIKQITNHEAACQYIMEYSENYLDGKGFTAKCYSNLLKAIPPGYTSPGFLQDVADITLKDGSERGRVVFRERLLKYMSSVPESVLISLLAGFISQIFVHGQEVLRCKLEHIKLPELDLD